MLFRSGGLLVALTGKVSPCVGGVPSRAARAGQVGIALPPEMLAVSVASGVLYGAGTLAMVDALQAGGNSSVPPGACSCKGALWV